MVSLLQSLREIVDLTRDLITPREILDTLVKKLAQTLSVDMCSILLCEQNRKEIVLVASEGLCSSSLYQVKLKLGEGITGHIAQTKQVVNVAESRKHERYHYFPETKEENFNAFLGVPIIYLRELIGVLIVQDASKRQFSADEEAIVVTIAAHLAALLKHVNMTRKAETKKNVKGVSCSPGVVIAKTLVHNPTISLSEVGDFKITDCEREVRRYNIAVDKLKEEIEKARKVIVQQTSDDTSQIFDAYILMLSSQEFTQSIEKSIREGNWAPAALRDTVNHFTSRFQQMEDPYLRSRGDDVLHLGNRLNHLLHELDHDFSAIVEPTIILANDVSIQDIAQMSNPNLAGVVCSGGSSHSHAAILLNALGIPSIMGTGLLLGNFENYKDFAILDANQGLVVFRPTPEEIEKWTLIIEQDQSKKDELGDLKSSPGITLDGVKVDLFVNTGLTDDIMPGLLQGAEGVGLYRSEFLFMVNETIPTEAEQIIQYRRLLSTYSPKPVVMRTIDIGGDKMLPFYSVYEENPNLGWRGIRFALDNTNILQTQIKAMLLASRGFENLKIMIPMVSQLSEILSFKAILAKTLSELPDRVTQPKFGLMIEVPSTLFLIEEIAEHVDFISIGANDLTQFLLAVDRNNPKVESLFDWLEPSVVRAIFSVVKKGKAKGVEVGLCGEMASDPLAVILLIGMGFDNLSVSAYHLPKIKWIIRNIKSSECKSALTKALRCSQSHEIRNLLVAFLTRKKWAWLIPK